ncbi:MAG: ABC transporter permease [Oscillospiraceae bacterium]|nr:ABC transporter permease [Oscillospiraceae bacterium]
MNEKAARVNVKREETKEFLIRNFVYIGLVLVLILFEIMTKGRLLQKRNLMNIFNNFFLIGLSASAFTFIIAISELDLSTGAIVGISAALGALAGKTSVALVVPVCILTGLVAGSLNGFMIAKMKMASFIATLATSYVLKGLTTYLLDGSVGVDISIRVFDQNWIKITTLIAAVIIFYFLFEHCVIGKQSRAVGASAEAARQSGVHVEFIRFMPYLMIGLMCGIVGAFSLARSCTATTSTGSGFEFDILLAVLFGGMPLTGGWSVKYRSAILGSVTMAVLKSGMSLCGITGTAQQIVRGALLIIIVAITFDRKVVAAIK